MDALIQILGDRAVVTANEGELVTYLDKWSTHGYISSLIEKGDVYAIGKVIYDLNKVDINKVREISHKIAEGLFECPVCQKMIKENSSTGNNGDGEPINEEEKKEELHVVKEKPKDEPKELELELDEVEIRELERERAIQKIVSAMDEVLLMKMMR